MQSDSYGPGNGSPKAAPSKDALAAGDLHAEAEVLNTLGMAQVTLVQVDEGLARLRHAMPITPTASPAAAEPDSLRATLRAVRRSWWIILLSGAVAVAGGLAATQTQPASYEAVTSVLLADASGYQQAIAGGYNPIDAQRRQATISDLLTPALLKRAANRAGLPLGAAYTVTTAESANSDVMQIRASTGRARTAAALADATANELERFRQRTDANELRTARAVLLTQIAEARRAADRRALFSKLNNLAVLQALTDQGLQIIQRAQIPARASSPGALRTGAIALVLGILFGLAFSLLRSRDPAKPR
jgi:capsular polysaccharide biosynthesis protein